MNFHQLRCFYEVTQAQSFSGAAENLHLTQPAVTWQVSHLEEFYETKFLERIGKRVQLTAEGKVLMDFADKIFNLSRQAEEALADLKGLDRGTLRIDATFTFGDYYLATLLQAFHERYPRIVIQVTTGNSSQMVENTLLHKNDMAFTANDPKDDKLIARELVSDKLIAIVPPRHPLAKRKTMALWEIEGQPLILREQGSSPRRLVNEIFEKKKISPMIIMESASTSAIKKMVESGMGIAILSQQVVKKELRAKTLKSIPFTDAEISYRFYLIYHKDRYFSRALSAFREIALEHASKLLPE